MLEVSIHDADSMAEKHVSSAEDEIELFAPMEQGNWVWINIVRFDGPVQLSTSPALSPSEIFAFSGAPNLTSRPTCWLVRTSESSIRLIASGNRATRVRCCIATLPNPLKALLADADDETIEAMVAALDMACANRPFDARPFRSLDANTAFELLRGCAAVARRLGFFEVEIALLTRAIDIRSSPNQLRLLSHAYANAQNYHGAIMAADAAVRSNPELAKGPFGDHLDELKAYSDVGAELLGKEARIQGRPARSDKVGYCLHNSLPYRNGGYAMRSHSLLLALRAQNHDISAFVRPGFPIDGPSSSERPSGAKNIDGVEYHFANMFSRNGRTYGYVLEAADYLEEAFVLQDIGLVHAATNFWIGLPAAIAAKRLNLPFVYEARSFWEITREAQTPGYKDSPKGRRETALDAILLAMADAVVTLNGAMRNHIEAMGVDPERITIVPNCVDSEQFSVVERDSDLAALYGLSKDDIVIGYLGAMLGYEGIDLLVEAVGPLIADNPNVKLVIVGGDPAKRNDTLSIENQLKQQVEHLGLAANIVFVDRISPRQVPEHYGLFDICAYPRRSFEVCELVSPLKPLEAMAAGRTVIVSDVGGMSDILEDTRTGLVFEKDNVVSLRSRLQCALEDSALRNRVANAARKFAREERSWSRAATQLRAVYERARTTPKPETGHVEALVREYF